MEGFGETAGQAVTRRVWFEEGELWLLAPSGDFARLMSQVDETDVRVRKAKGLQ
jgi:hypothetical protein